MSKKIQHIDLNSDLGEGFGAYRMGDDAAIMAIVSSANVACGLHAGDPHIMVRSFAQARDLGVTVGAHPGYPDLWGFGRRDLAFSPAEIEHFVAYQIGAALGASRLAGHPIRYVKPHGALANTSHTNAVVAAAIVKAIKAIDPELVLLTFPDGEARRLAQEAGLATCAEIFADRAYNADATLVSRKLPGAVLHDVEFAAARALRMVAQGGIETIEGTVVPMDIGSICVHGDSPDAIAMAKAVRTRLEGAGISIKAFA
ncbi:MAG: hypothetical protein RLZZ502_1561 [Pseudomonadota bacterium]|jgi:UPF0271 protein